MQQYIIVFEVMAGLSSWIAWPAIHRIKYLRVFPFLLTLIVGVELSQVLSVPGFIENNAIIYNLLEPIQWTLYAWSFYIAFQSVVYRKFLWFSGVLYYLVFAISFPFYLQSQHYNVIVYALGSVILIVAALMKFYEMLKSPVDFNFLRLPYFYIVFAFLLFTLGTMPYFTMGNWLYYELNQRQTALVFRDVMSFMNLLLYATYTTCFLWIRVKKVSF
ncbi:MAG: hypothetical protein AAFQ98_00830 [Bacteroidota bacterium]